ncbi:phosphoglycerate mutase family protein [Maribacter sp. 2304DJ31-5]|uniref:phosphoglycerate mutase family protein n=1 Tax=Maribacter sp. 2304DJ31-5 TaxID=3386273 RepID=UPI0039BC5610
MKYLKYIALSMLFITLSCKDEKPIAHQEQQTNISTFYLIRHAEKDRNDTENTDPELNQKGLGRAMHWAEILNDVDLDVIYSTDYNRTSMTAAPTSVKKNIDVRYYDPRTMNVEQFKADNLNKKVLIVGHGNTIPALVNQFLGEEKYGQIDDHENGTLFIVQIVNGTATDSKLTFNCNCPD